MPLETGTYISDFNASNPAHSDALSQADSHMRWIKQAVLNTFTGITGAVTATHTQLNSAVAAVVTGTTAALHFAGTVAAPGVTFVGNTACGLVATGTNALALVTSGASALAINAAGLVTIGALSVTGAYAGGTGQLGVIGEPRLWLSSTLPSGNFIWLNGQAISRTGNPVLFALWGTTYGTGDGSTTFNVPNFQEVTPVGVKGMGGGADPGRIAASGVNANIGTMGAIVGEGTHMLAQAELPNVAPTASSTSTFTGTQQTWSLNQNNIVANNGAGGQLGNTNGNTIQPTVTITPSGTVATTTTVGSINGNQTEQGHNNVQPGIACGWITLAG